MATLITYSFFYNRALHLADLITELNGALSILFTYLLNWPANSTASRILWFHVHHQLHAILPRTL